MGLFVKLEAYHYIATENPIFLMNACLSKPKKAVLYFSISIYKTCKKLQDTKNR